MVAGGASKLSCSDLEDCIKLYHSLGLDVVKVDSRGEPLRNTNDARGLAVSLNSTSRLQYLEFPDANTYYGIAS